MENPPIEPTKKTEDKSLKGQILELVRFALIALVIVIPIRLFIAQPFIVSGSSMFPTFQNRNYLIVDELTYRLEKPSRGDIAVFRYPLDTSKYFIKRIIGLPGETVDITYAGVTIINRQNPKGFMLNEPYVKNTMIYQPLEKTLGPNEYFVMGDNRPDSSDSRYWGSVPTGDLVGRVFLRLYPFNAIGVFPGDYTQYQTISTAPTSTQGI